MALRGATLLNNPEKCTMEGKGVEHHLPAKASNMEIVRESPWQEKRRNP
jgi:hypothetical protein